MRNNIDLLITLIRYTRLNKMQKYEIIKYFQIDLKNSSLIKKPSNKVKSILSIKRTL